MEIRKKVTTCIVGALMSLGSLAGTTHAAPCNGVTLDEVGMWPAFTSDTTTNLDDFYVFVKCDPTWTKSTVFFLNPDLGEAGYATLLTAISTGATLNMDVASYAWGSLINNIKINKLP